MDPRSVSTRIQNTFTSGELDTVTVEYTGGKTLTGWVQKVRWTDPPSVYVVPQPPDEEFTISWSKALRITLNFSNGKTQVFER